MQIPNDFFTVTSIGTLAGASAAVVLVTSIIGYLFNLKTSQTVKKWLSLGLSFALSFLAVSLVEDKTTSTWVVATLNSFLIFATATGVNAIYGTAPAPAPSRAPAARTKSVEFTKGATMPKGVSVSKARGRFTDRWW